MSDLISFNRLREFLAYDPATGVFRWRVDRKRVRRGDIAGSRSSAWGYWIIRVDQLNYMAHRLAYLYMTGAWPVGDIDHIDGVRANNAWANLRPITAALNGQNRHRSSKRSQSQLLGAFPHGTGRWRAQISLRGKRRELGIFDTAEAAHSAYLKAKLELHPGWVPQEGGMAHL